MEHAIYLYPRFGSAPQPVKYTESASESAFHYFILVSDPALFVRFGIRVATFSFAKTDFRLEQPVVRYGNTDPRVVLPVPEFEEAILEAIRAKENLQNVQPDRYEAVLKQVRLETEVELN